MTYPCNDQEPPKRKDVPKWVTLLAWVCLIALVSVLMLWIEAKAQTGEPLGTQIDWAPHPALGVVIAYKVDGENVFYAHPVIAQGPFPECKEGMGKIRECQEVRIMNGAIHLITMDAGMPYLYVAGIIPTAKRVGDGEFTSLVSATWKRCE